MQSVEHARRGELLCGASLMERTPMMAEATTEFTATLEAIAASRGLTLEEACERTVTRPASNRKLTIELLDEGGFYRFGDALDHVLHFTEEERGRLIRAYSRSFLS
jgi:hypothetical protein